MNKTLACISIDVDSLASIYKGLGCTHPGGYTYIEFRTGMENLARFFERFNIKATLFMVGGDFKYQANIPTIKAVHKAGHEIANHSMSHPQGFRYLSAEEKETELRAMGDICRETVGEAPIGFRSPGWNIDDETIPVLQKLGYHYDSSVFPTFLMPVMKFAHWRSMSKQPAPVRTTMGQYSYMFAPLRPYPHQRKQPCQKRQGRIDRISHLCFPHLTHSFLRDPVDLHGSGLLPSSISPHTAA